MRIVIGDLRHKTVGRHSAFMPIATEYLASYARSVLGMEAIEVITEDDPDRILSLIVENCPHVVALSNYCWNSELNRVVFERAKEISPESVCIAGGPEFPMDREEAQSYLQSRWPIDFYVLQEGEVTFACLLKMLAFSTVSEIQAEAHPGLAFLERGTGRLVIGPPQERLAACRT